ncbi:uncharacterized protein LOC117114608 [Anneissia japonica]|uniref:uncharacterized protein LOC117114608 n=1 Tax=Anneissia japonica TaxID=1529436 RepID=UPI0014258451|nr:uncharacterized protein LOC117114608 [Anneissia japonica]
MEIVTIICVVLVAISAVLSQLEVSYDPLIVSKSVVLAKTPKQVFYYVADFHNHNKWIGGISKTEELDGSLMGEGKLFHQMVETPFVGEVRHQIEILQYNPPSKVVYNSDMELLKPRIELEITPGSKVGHTRLTWKTYSRRRSYLFCVTVLPISQYISNENLRSTLFNLRTLIH